MSSAQEDMIIGLRFHGHDGHDRHVWNVRDSRVHYFSRTPGSHWTPGHSVEDAPTLTAFHQSCRPVRAGPEQADGGETRSAFPRAADPAGDF